MNVTHIRYTPAALCAFSLAEVDVMIELAARHSDPVCCAMASENIGLGRVGLLRGMRNRILNCGAGEETPLTHRELNALAVVLGGNRQLPPERARLASDLRHRVTVTMQRLSEHALNDYLMGDHPIQRILDDRQLHVRVVNDCLQPAGLAPVAAAS